MLINILLSILILTRLVIGVRLFITGRHNHLPNLIWLSSSMFLTAVTLLFAPSEGNPLANLPISIWAFFGGTFASLVPVIVFNQFTFYKDRKSPAAWVWIVFIASFTVALYGVVISESNYKQSPWLAAYIPGTVLIWAWHGWAAYQAFKQVASQPSIEHWVKARYQLMTVYAVMLAFSVLMSFIRIVFAGGSSLTILGSVTGALTLLAQIISLVLMFLVWVMPESFRIWLNREQRTHLDDEHPISVLDVFGAAMTDNTGLKRMACFYAIRATVAKNIGSEDSTIIRAQIDRMSYADWDNILKQPELRRILMNSGADTESSGKAIENAQRALVDKQSLLTFRAY